MTDRTTNLADQTTEDLVTGGLARMLRPAQDNSPKDTLNRRQGVVTAIATGPPPTLTVTIGATSVPGVRYFDWYIPTVNDVVFLDFDGSTPVVIGKLAGTSGGGDFARGILAEAAAQDPVGVATIAAGFTSESVWTSLPAIQTFLGRTYELTVKLRIVVPDQQATIHIKRGTTTAGASVGFIEVDSPTGGNGRSVMFSELDRPGAQAAQQWCVTFSKGGTGGDLKHPSRFYVKDISIG